MSASVQVCVRDLFISGGSERKIRWMESDNSVPTTCDVTMNAPNSDALSMQFTSQIHPKLHRQDVLLDVVFDVVYIGAMYFLM